MSGRWPGARAEIYRYSDPGHRDDGTWSFQVIACPWTKAMPDGPDGRPLSHILDVPGDQVAYPSWRLALWAALVAVADCRGELPTWSTTDQLARMSVEAAHRA